MRTSFRCMFLGLLLSLFFPAAPVVADKLDDLVKREQADVDNEAVVVYGGSVGKLDAIFSMEWTGTGGRVDGRYFHPSKGKEQAYILEGDNPGEGVLNLREYTVAADGKRTLTATCRLTKRVTKDRIIWEGKMNNTDGRVLPISFSRPR